MSSLRSAATLFAVAGLACLLTGTRPSRATETLAAADFEEESAGTTARPGIPGVQGEVYDDSTTTGGDSQVVSWSGGKRYHLGNEDTSAARRGIRMPLSETVSSGTLAVSAVISAEQTDAGGGLIARGPDDQDWNGRVEFGSNGNFKVHGTATSVAYTSGHRYQVAMTFRFGLFGGVDYEIVDLDADETVYSSTGSGLLLEAEVADLLFSTGTSDEGAFTIDDVLATR